MIVLTRKIRTLSAFVAPLIALIFLSGCASTRSVPMTVQSDPLGAIVLYQLKSTTRQDWIYLGNTPLDTRREVNKKLLKDADAFILRVMKDGFIDQQKAWNGAEVVDQVKEKGTVFWNPRLVPAN